MIPIPGALERRLRTIEAALASLGVDLAAVAEDVKRVEAVMPGLKRPKPTK